MDLLGWRGGTQSLENEPAAATLGARSRATEPGRGPNLRHSEACVPRSREREKRPATGEALATTGKKLYFLHTPAYV